jgi:signal transduction histidine kinase
MTDKKKDSGENLINTTASTSELSENYYKEIELLREQSQRFMLSQQIGNFCCFEMNIEQGSIWFSEAAPALLAIKKNNLPKSNTDFFNLFIDEDREILQNQIEGVLAKKNELNFDGRLLSTDKDLGELRILNLRAKIVNDLRRRPSRIAGIIQDISTQKKTENKLLKLKRTAEESDRLKSAFLANMSHEIRTPMNAIIGFSELLNMPDVPYEKKKEYAQIIKKKGNDLLSLIDDIIEISKFENGQLSISKTEFNLPAFMKENLSIFRDRKDKLGKDLISIELKIPKDNEITSIYADQGRLYQVLSNLITNALQFTNRGVIKFGYKLEDNRKLRFFVKDNGTPLTKKEQKHIFNRFRQVEETTIKKFTSSGLGLTISKMIVDLMDGRIGLKAEDEGNTFFFTISVEYPPKKTKKQNAIDTEQSDYSWKDKVVLIVEDDEVNFRFLEAVLQKTEAQIIHAIDGLQAVELCNSISQIDLVLMDIKMPELNGFDATKQIKSKRKDLPIIAQTAFSLIEDKNKCFKAGCDDYISKPIDIDLLYRKIARFFS